jgi:hypothetical protein
LTLVFDDDQAIWRESTISKPYLVRSGNPAFTIRID